MRLIKRLLMVVYIGMFAPAFAGNSVGTSPSAPGSIPPPPMAAYDEKPEVSQTSRGPIIVLDPGHGGKSTVGGSSPNNATGPRGLKEKDVTLLVAFQARTALQRLGYQVLLTRTGDTNVGLWDRATLARQNHAKAFVSIHFNGFKNPDTQGTEVWVGPFPLDASKRLGDLVRHRLIAVTGAKDRGLKSGSYVVVNSTNFTQETASCLAEISFLTDPAEETRLSDSQYVAEIGSAIGNAVDDYCRRKARGPIPEARSEVPLDLDKQ